MLTVQSQQDRQAAERLVDLLFDAPSELTADAGRVEDVAKRMNESGAGRAEGVAKRISESPERMAQSDATSSPGGGSGSGGSRSQSNSMHRGSGPLLPADVLARPRRKASGQNSRPNTSGSVGSLSSLDKSHHASPYATAAASPSSPRITFVDTDRQAAVTA